MLRLSFLSLPSLKIVVALFILVSIARGQSTEKVLTNFTSARPNGGLVFDRVGNLYGTGTGFASYFGQVFELQHLTDGRWIHKIIYQFKGADGGYPQPGPIFDDAGNLYGAATVGGSHFCLYTQQSNTCGIVFELTPTAQGEWTEKILYDFAGGMDGANPTTGVISDTAGNLYGTTILGGLGHGTVFRLQPGPDGTWTEKVLYRFVDNLGGVLPSGGLVLDDAGNLFGTTHSGGKTGNGTIFELSPGPGDTWTFRSLHSFCLRVGCPDGQFPVGLVLDSKGNLYGTTVMGGNTPCSWQPTGCGVAFEHIRGQNGTWTFRVLYSFCSLDSCADGAGPYGSMVFDNGGSLYGAAPVGGNTNQGALFKLSHVLGHPWTIQTLYSFCPLPFDCLDGRNPMGSVVRDDAGNFYGTTIDGGKAGGGVAFEVTP